MNPGTPRKNLSGIRIQRHFTKEGVHPYDEVGWEFRTAKVGSGDRVVFEQHQVEVPEFWSQNATNIVAQKYFAYGLADPRRESSVKQLIDRVVITIAAEGEKNGYFSPEEREAFEAELTYILLHQRAAFNSPVWFNVGIMERPACSACYILHIEDSLKSIGRWQMEETEIFRNGSGAGINLSNLRGAEEQLSRGGVSSGPVNFMRAADANAGTIASGGRTRRAAKLVCLDADHPDIFDFIWCKAREEDRIRALAAAGFDMNLGTEVGEKNLAEATAYQNANNSVRITQELLDAAENDEDWNLIRRTDGEIAKTVKAREILEAIAEASWKCADPGVQYDTTINDWHTTPGLGRINGSNPCFPAGEKVMTKSHGEIEIEKLYSLYCAGEKIRIYTYDGVRRRIDEFEEMEGRSINASGITTSSITAFGDSVVKPVLKLRLVSSGSDSESVIKELRCTADHRIWTENREWVKAEELEEDDCIIGFNGQPWEKQQYQLLDIEEDGNELVYNLTEPKNHSYIVNGVVVANCSEYMHVDNSSCNLASLNLLTFLNNDGTFNIDDFKHVVRIVFTAQDITICFAHFPTKKIGDNSRNLRQIGIGYANLGALLMNLGYAYDSDEGRQVTGAITSLLTGESYLQSTHIAERVGAYHQYPETAESMQRVLRKHFAASKTLNGVFADVAAASRESWGGSIRRCKKHGIRNCQASVAAPTGCLTGDTLVHTRDGLVPLDTLGDPTGMQWQDVDFEVLTDEGWKRATKFFINGVEPIVTIKTSTGREIRSTAKHQIKVQEIDDEFVVEAGERPKTDSELNFKNVWKHVSDIIVGDVVPTVDSIRVLVAHAASLNYDGSVEHSDREIPEANYEEVISVELTEEEMTYDLSVPENVTYIANGFISHNTVSFLMDCDTTGIEPDFALIKHKTLAGGGTMSIPNKAISQALRNLGYEADQIDDIIAYIAEEENGYPRGNVVGAPHLKEEHCSVFDCAVGDRSISAEGHIKMMAAAQPFFSGAISKTVNLPNNTTVQEIADLYALGGKLGLKAIAVYRDGCKNFQPLADANKTKDRPEEAVKAVEERLTSILGDGLLRGERRQLSRDADVRRVKFRVGMISGYIHVGLFDDGRPGDVFINVGQAGSTLRGFIDAWGIAISLALQHGTPLDIIVSKLANQQFEPHGFTDDEHIRNAKSIVDYVVKWMAMEFLPDEAVYTELGITKPLHGSIATEGAKELGSEKQAASEGAVLDPTESDGPAAPEIRPRVDIHSATVPSVRKIVVKTASDVKLCGSCGTGMVRTGVCYTCPSCGENSGGCS